MRGRWTPIKTPKESFSLPSEKIFRHTHQNTHTAPIVKTSKVHKPSPKPQHAPRRPANGLSRHSKSSANIQITASSLHQWHL